MVAIYARTKNPNPCKRLRSDQRPPQESSQPLLEDSFLDEPYRREFHGGIYVLTAY